jgi:hypothetical protein
MIIRKKLSGNLLEATNWRLQTQPGHGTITVKFHVACSIPLASFVTCEELEILYVK